MTEKSAILRVAKILARAGSDQPGEADAALYGAYKRMVRDGVTLRDLLSLPTEELYQNTLVKLVEVILDGQPNLSLASRREAYSEYLLLIAARFSGAWDGQTSSSGGGKTGAGQGSSREQEARAYEERRAREEASRQRTHSPPPHEDTATAQETPHRNYQNRSIRLGKFSFSFSPAGFLAALQALFGLGSVLWHTLRNPLRGLRLFAASLLWGAGFASVVLLLAALLHVWTGTGPLWDIQLKNAFSFLVAVGALWKMRLLHHNGWFR